MSALEQARADIGAMKATEGIILDPNEACYAMENDDEVSIDLETGGLNPWSDPIAVVTMKGATSGARALLHVRGNVPNVLINFLSKKDRLLIGHNIAGFDAIFLALNGVDYLAPRYFDTMIGEQVTIKSGRRDIRVNLQDTLERRLGVRVKKGEAKSTWMAQTLTEEQIRYCVEDVSYLHDLRKAQLAACEGTPQARAMRFEQSIVPIVVQMVINGLPIDLDALDVWLRQSEVNAADALKLLDARCGRFNVNSSKQVQEMYGRVFNIHLYSADKVTLTPLSQREDEVGQITTALLTARQAQKRTNMYGDEWRGKYVVDGRVHARFWSCVAASSLVEMPRNLAKYPRGVPIPEIKPGEWVYSFDKDLKFCLRRVKWVSKTGVKRTLRIKLVGTSKHDVRMELRLTHDHLVRMRNGEWRYAKDLKVHDSLLSMPIRLSTSKERYSAFFCQDERYGLNVCAKWTIEEHRWIYEQLHSVVSSDNNHIHHKDEDSWNNYPDNLQDISRGVHLAMHNQEITEKDVKEAIRDPKSWKWHPRTLRLKIAELGLSAPRGISARVSYDPLARHIRRTEKHRTLVGALNLPWASSTNYVITSIEEYGEEEVWDMEVEDTHSFIANGVAVHNCSTDTSRFSSSEPNLQQVPVNGRQVFGGVEGHKIVSVDFSQLEIRVAAAMANDSRMIEALSRDDGPDIHTTVAMSVFGIAEADVTKELRKKAKALVFTLLFGGGADAIVTNAMMGGATVTKAEAKYMLNQFFNTYRGLRAAREQAQDLASSGRPVPITLASGFRRVLVPSGGYVNSTQILNTNVQGNAAVGLKRALLYMDEWGLIPYVCAVVHDETVSVVPDAMVDEVKGYIEEAMIRGMQLVIPNCPIKVESKVGTHWS